MKNKWLLFAASAFLLSACGQGADGPAEEELGQTSDAVSACVLMPSNTILGIGAQSGCGGYFMTMQGDGNFVLYSDSWVPYWSSNTVGTGANVAAMQHDGNLVVYTPWGHVFATNSGGRHGANVQIVPRTECVEYDPWGYGYCFREETYHDVALISHEGKRRYTFAWSVP